MALTYDTGDRTVINLGDEGLSDGDTIDGYLIDHAAPDTALIIPPGTYDWDGDGLDELDDHSNLMVAGAFDSNTGEVLTHFHPTASCRVWGEWQDCEFWNVYIDRENQDSTAGFYPHGEDARIVRLHHPHGGPIDRDRFMYQGEYDVGRTYFERSSWAWYVNNGAYTDKNPSNFTRCVGINNNISQFRVGDRSTGTGTTLLDRCLIGCTRQPDDDSVNSPNGRGIYFRREGRVVVRDCWFVYFDNHGDAISINSGAEGGELVLEGDVHFHLEGGAAGIDGASNVSVDDSNANITVSGTSNPDFDGAISDYTVISESEAHVPTPAAVTGCTQADLISGLDLDTWAGWDASAAPSGDDTTDGTTDDGTSGNEPLEHGWERRYTPEVDRFGTGPDVLAPYTSRTNTADQWFRETDDTLTEANAGDALRAEPPGPTAIESHEDDGLYRRPQWGDTFDFWTRHESVGQGAQSWFRFFLTPEQDGYVGYSVEFGGVNNTPELELREFFLEDTSELYARTDLSYNANEYYRVVIDTDADEKTIDVWVEDTAGTELARLPTVTDTGGPEGDGIMLRVPNSFPSGEAVWWDNIDVVGITPDNLIENFAHNSLSTHYTRTNTCADSEGFALDTGVHREAGVSMRYSGAASGFDRRDGGPDESSIYSEVGDTYAVDQVGHFRKSSATGTDTLVSYRWAVDSASPDGTYAAVQFDVSGGSIALMARKGGGTIEELDRIDYDYPADEWHRFDITTDPNAPEEFTVQFDADDPNRPTIELSGTHSTGTGGYGTELAWYGTGTAGGFFVDEVYEPGVGVLHDDDPITTDPNQWALLDSLSNATSNIQNIAWSPDGDEFAYATGSGPLFVHDGTSPWTAHTERDHTGGVRDLAYSPDGAYLAVPVLDSEDVIIYDTNGLGQEAIFGSSQHIGRCSSVEWGVDGERLYVGTEDGYVHVYDTTATLPANWSIETTLNHSGDSAGSGVVDIDVSDDGRYLAFAIRSGVTYVYTVGEFDDHQQRFPTGSGTHQSVAWAPDAEWLAHAGGDGTVWVRDVADAFSLTHSLSPEPGVIQRVAFTPDGRYLATTHAVGDSASLSATVHVYDATSGFARERGLSATDSNTRALAFSPQSGFLTYAGDDADTVYIHRVPAWQPADLTVGATVAAHLRERHVYASASLSVSATVDVVSSVDGTSYWYVGTGDDTTLSADGGAQAMPSAVAADGVLADELPTATPGEEVTFEFYFDRYSDIDVAFDERHETILRYADIDTDTVVSRGVSADGTPWFRERLPADAPVDSLVVPITAGANVETAREFWGVVVGVEDTSSTVSKAYRTCEVTLFVLGTLNDFEDRADVYDTAGSPVV